MWESASIDTERREKEQETESEVVLCIDLYVSVRLAIKGEEDKHHNWMFIIGDGWLRRAESLLQPPPTQECPLTVTAYLASMQV